MHYTDANETHGEKARRELKKRMLRTVLNLSRKAAAVKPLTFHLTSHLSKTNDMNGIANEVKTLK